MNILIIVAAIFLVIIVVFARSSKSEQRRRQGRVRRVRPGQTSDVYVSPTDIGLLQHTSHIHSDAVSHGDTHAGIYATDSNASSMESRGSWESGGGSDFGGFDGGGDFGGGGGGGDFGGGGDSGGGGGDS
jgi:hypothetical protein